VSRPVRIEDLADLGGALAAVAVPVGPLGRVHRPGCSGRSGTEAGFDPATGDGVIMAGPAPAAPGVQPK
jgi:hypothetical protein